MRYFKTSEGEGRMRYPKTSECWMDHSEDQSTTREDALGLSDKSLKRRFEIIVHLNKPGTFLSDIERIGAYLQQHGQKLIDSTMGEFPFITGVELNLVTGEGR